MNALLNADTRRGGNNPPNAGLASNVFPEAQSSPTGVSVKYAPNPDKQWFVLRVTYNRENKAYDFLTKNHVEAYLPLHYVEKTVRGKKKRVLESLLPNILFVYSTQEQVETYVKHTPTLSFLSYYYNHFQTDANGNNPPLTIGYDEMMNFIRVTSVEDEYVKVVDPQSCRYKSGDKVRIVEGKFTGIEGRVARVSGQQCVIVELTGLCLVATAYVPSGCLKKLETTEL